MTFMKFEFILDTNSNDVEYETEQSESRVRKILGFNRVYDYKYVETLADPPYGSPSNAQSE